MPFEKDDLKPIEGIARLGAVTAAGFLYFMTFPISSFMPRRVVGVFKQLADFDPGKYGKKPASAAAPRAAAPAAAKPAAAKPAPAKPAAKPAE